MVRRFKIGGNLKRTIEKEKQVYSWAKRHQVPIAFGTDFRGTEAQRSQPREFETRLELDAASGILRSATVINAELLMQKGSLGTVSPGAYADLAPRGAAAVITVDFQDPPLSRSAAALRPCAAARLHLNIFR